MAATIAQPASPNPLAGFRRLAGVRELPILVVLIAIFAITTLMQPRFVSADNTRSIFVSIALLAVLAMGEMAVLLTRGVDVSIGSIMGLSGMIVAVLFRERHIESLFVGTVAAVLIGA